MKKKSLLKIFLAFILAIGIFVNISPFLNSKTLSLSDIRVMVNAYAECDNYTIEGLVCWADATGKKWCLQGGEPRVFCAKKPKK